MIKIPVHELSQVVKELPLCVHTLPTTSFPWGVWSSHHVIHSNLRPRLPRVVVINIPLDWRREQPDIGIAICIVSLGNENDNGKLSAGGIVWRSGKVSKQWIIFNNILNNQPDAIVVVDSTAW